MIMKLTGFFYETLQTYYIKLSGNESVVVIKQSIMVLSAELHT